MVISTILDPTVFDTQYFSSELHRREVELYLKAIQENGLIIVDPNDMIRSELLSRAERLGVVSGQQIQIRLAEIAKSKKKLIPCVPGNCFNLNSVPIHELVYNIVTRTEVDVAIISNNTMNALLNHHVRDTRLIGITEYSCSTVEEKRRKFIADLPPIDEMRHADVEDLFLRIVRYSKTLKIYDKQIGQCKNLNNFLRSISFILDLWVNGGYFDNKILEIITLQKREIECDENQKAHRLLVNSILCPLREKYKKYQIRIDLRVKKARPPQYHPQTFHARYLQSDYAIVLLERGFDFLKKGGEFHSCSLVLKNADSNHLSRYYSLPDCILL